MVKVYLGFSIDMDSAHSLFNTHGVLITSDMKEYEKYKKLQESFITLTNKLIDYFKKNNYQNSVSWLVNENAYNITNVYNDLLEKCIMYGGEIGLHTHFNSVSLNGAELYMSNNKNDWLNKGLIEPTKRLNMFNNNEHILIFKAGNHMRNNEMFKSLIDIGFKIDCTKVIDDYLINENVMIFDDRDIKLGSEPFFMDFDGENILEIPEIRVDKVLKHIEQCTKNNSLIFIKLQIHHWQYDELIPQFDKLIDQLKSLNYDLEFINLKEMQRIYFKKIEEKQDCIVKKIIQNKLPNDLYYNSISYSFGNNFSDVVIYLFNNYSSSTKILEIFSGIGQYSYLLSSYGFSNLSILDFENDRLNKFPNIKSIYGDFYEYNINDYEIVFATNSINTSLENNIDKQILKYKTFLLNNLNKCLILNIDNYASEDKQVVLKILNEFETSENFMIKYLNKSYVVIKYYDNNQIKPYPFSNQFKTYNLINFKNVKGSIINENNQEIIELKFINNEISNSFGIFFPLYNFKNIYDINYNLEFEIKSNKPIFLKVYNGIVWNNIENIEWKPDEYIKINFTSKFNFETKSTYRIGFNQIQDGTIVYFKNINLKS